MGKNTALLIDTVSIQDYVFAGSKLKENLGASYLVGSIYDFQKLANKPLENPGGYTGGGNALLFFDGSEEAESFVKEWSTLLLADYPGIKTAVAIGEIEFENENDTMFKEGKDKLFEQLNANKYKFHPRVALPSHGITADCSRTGLSAEEWLAAGDNSQYISSVSMAKENALEKASEEIKSDFPCIPENGLNITNELDELGSSKGEDSRLAIVHIDGNGMGKRFERCDTLKKTKDLSRSLEEATKGAFDKLLNFIIDNIDHIKEAIDIKENILPVRPIILGGDDITFACDGRLGVYFAQKYLEAFQTFNVSDGEKISACAGVAITRLKYPFAKGYQLAEELCRNAKKKRKEMNDNGSWIDFHISYGNISGQLEDIRKSYRAEQGNLLMRPYKLAEDNQEYGFYNLINNTKEFFKKENGKNKFPNSKIHELREVLTLGKEACESFVKELEARKLRLPAVKGNKLTGSLFADMQTPYFDMIELSGIYPKFELEKED